INEGCEMVHRRQTDVDDLAASRGELRFGQAFPSVLGEEITAGSWDALVVELGVHALLPRPPLVHQRHVEASLSPDFEHLDRRDPRLRKAILHQQLAQMTSISPI